MEVQGKITRVTLREKLLKDGKEKSLYLDFYPACILADGSKTRRHFLNLRIYNRPKSEPEKRHNKETKIKAEFLKNEITNQIYKGIYRLEEFTKQKDRDLIAFMRNFASQYKENTADSWKTMISHFIKFYGDFCPIKNVSENLANDFQDYLLQAIPSKTNTVLTYYTKFKKVLKELYKKELISRDLAYLVRFKGKKVETQKEFLTLEEVTKLAQTPFPDYPAIPKAFLFSCLTGLRWSDCEKLTHKEIQGNVNEGFNIRFTQKKTGSPETIPLSNQALSLIGELKNSDERVFSDLPHYDVVCKKIHLWVARAGILKRITYHTSRHTFATLSLGFTDIYTVSSLLGHRELRSTQIYARVLDARKRDSVNQFPLILG